MRGEAGEKQKGSREDIGKKNNSEVGEGSGKENQQQVEARGYGRRDGRWWCGAPVMDRWMGGGGAPPHRPRRGGGRWWRRRWGKER